MSKEHIQQFLEKLEEDSVWTFIIVSKREVESNPDTYEELIDSRAKVAASTLKNAIGQHLKKTQ